MHTRKAYETREAPGAVSDDQPDAREGQAGRPGVAERFVVPVKPCSAGGGKGPQFKTDAIRGEGHGDWATYQIRRVFRNCRWRCTRTQRREVLSESRMRVICLSGSMSGRNGAMVEPLRHRQSKEAATDMFSLQPPRHISTLPISTFTTDQSRGMAPKLLVSILAYTFGRRERFAVRESVSISRNALAARLGWRSRCVST